MGPIVISRCALTLTDPSLSLPPDFSLERVQDTSREEQRRRISQNPLLEIPRGARIRRIYRIYRTHFRAHTTVFALSFMGWEIFVNRHSQRRLEGIEDFPLTATLNLQRCLWTFHSALPSMGAFGAAVIVKTDLPSLHHLRPLTTEPFVYSHAGGFIISVTTRRIGRRKETNYLSRDECLRWEKGKGRERERGKGCHAGFHSDDFHEMIISWWNLLFFFCNGAGNWNSIEGTTFVEFFR